MSAHNGGEHARRMAKRAAASHGQANGKHGISSVGSCGQGTQVSLAQGADGGRQRGLGCQHSIGLAGFHGACEAVEGESETS